MLTACNNINVIKVVKSVKTLKFKLFYQLNVLWLLLIKPTINRFIEIDIQLFFTIQSENY